MKHFRLFLMVLAITLIFSLQTFAAVIYVSTSGNNSWSGSTWGDAKLTIQAAVDAAGFGSEIWVAKGTYAEHIIMKANVKLYGGFAGTETSLSQRPCFPRPGTDSNETVINGSGTGIVVTFDTGGTTTTTRIDGFTITNGSGDGGGIYCYESSPTITNNKITGNDSPTINFPHGGGGIYCNMNSSPVICNNVISDNTAAHWGGGILIYSGLAVVKNNLIVGNDASVGGGIWVDSAAPTIISNTVVDNTCSGNGGGIGYWYCGPATSNNLVAFNTSGIYRYGYSSAQTLNNNCSYNPGGYDFSGWTPDPVGLNGNISTDPMLANRAGGNYHIKGNSPCKDAGDDSTVVAGDRDMDNQLRKLGSHVDIGADEFRKWRSDFNGGGADDLVGLIQGGRVYYTTDKTSWTDTTGSLVSTVSGDINGDGVSEIIGTSGTNAIWYYTIDGTWHNIPGRLTKFTVGDLNGDGAADLAGINPSGLIRYTTNKTNWSTITGALTSIASGDFNGDGDDDLIGLSSSGNIYYSVNKATWTKLSGKLSSLTVGNFNGDDKDDFAGLSSTGAIWYYVFGDGWHSIPGNFVKLVTGDFNGDGDDDIAGRGSSSTIWYTTNKTTLTQIPGWASDMAVGDFNSDGSDDIAIIAKFGGIGWVFYTSDKANWINVPGLFTRISAAR